QRLPGLTAPRQLLAHPLPAKTSAAGRTNKAGARRRDARAGAEREQGGIDDQRWYQRQKSEAEGRGGEAQGRAAAAPAEVVDAVVGAVAGADRMGDARRRVPEERRHAGEESLVVEAVERVDANAGDVDEAHPRPLASEVEQVHAVHRVELRVRPHHVL